MLHVTIMIKVEEKKKKRKKTIGTQTQNNEKNVENDDLIFIKKIPWHLRERLKRKTRKRIKC